ncbi:D-glycerate dehydrogenase [Candidatus Bathyarchaeota archaeon]|nr:MAG: D-glycerate dehydrogenase [Candidatus Bathyarchaeota archaeon]TET93358.1 MAG: D-glycerate dehydrogenase [Desulfobacteraceae bacterium]
MDRKKIFITRKIPEAGVEKLKEIFDVEVSPFDRDLTQDEIIKMSTGAQGLIPMITNNINREIIDHLTTMQIIANYAVGFNNIDIEYARKKGIVVTNTPDILTEATADIAMALILCAARRIVEGDRLVRKGGFKGFYPTFFLGVELQNKVLGIYGMGRIGKAIAKRAIPCGLKIIYYDPIHIAEESIDFPAHYISFDELLKESDFISIHAPLTTETHHRFTKKEFRKMKKEAFLINAARGPLVKEEDLVYALKQKWIAGAGLDVYEFEPEVHPDLIKLDNVVLLPHIGSAASEVRERMAMIAADNLIAFFKGEPPPNRVN